MEEKGWEGVTWATTFLCSAEKLSLFLQLQPKAQLGNNNNEAINETNKEVGLRFLTKSLVIFSPFCAQPIKRTAMATPFLGNQPLSSSSEIFQIVPRVVGGSLAPPNTLTATSPVRIPVFCGSAWKNI